MPRKLATIQTIKEILPIEGADAIELATFEEMGWRCVVKKGEFKPKDPCVYFEIDSLLPLTPEFEFLAAGSSPKKTVVDGEEVEGYRLKTVRLRGQISQGLALPIKSLINLALGNRKYERVIKDVSHTRVTVTPERVTVKFPTEEDALNQEDYVLALVYRFLNAPVVPFDYSARSDLFQGSLRFQVGGEAPRQLVWDSRHADNDVTFTLGIHKYEPPVSPQLAGDAKGPLPGFIPRTDEERIQTCVRILNKYKHLEWYESIKYDGCSATFYKYEGYTGACSRNTDYLETEKNTFWKIANKHNLKETLPEGFAIQGELYGEGIAKNPHKIKGQDFVAFNVYNIQEGKYLDFEDAKKFVEDLGLKWVESKVLGTLEGETMESLLERADQTGLEGLVFRPLKEVTDVAFGRVSFKAISNKYLLKHD